MSLRGRKWFIQHRRGMDPQAATDTRVGDPLDVRPESLQFLQNTSFVQHVHPGMFDQSDSNVLMGLSRMGLKRPVEVFRDVFQTGIDDILSLFGLGFKKQNGTSTTSNKVKSGS